MDSQKNFIGWFYGLVTEDDIVGFAKWVIRWRWAVILLTFVVAGAAGFGGSKLQFSNDYRVFFSDRNPQLEAFEALQKVYTKDDNISFILKPNNGDIFTPGHLAAIKKLTEAAWKVPFTRRVDSITNFQYSHAEGDELIVRDLVPDPENMSKTALDETKAIALAEPLINNRLLSPSAETTNVNVTLILPHNPTDEVQKTMAYARQLATDFRKENPDVHVAVTGLTPLSNAFFEASVSDMTTLVPLMYGVLLFTMIVLLRSFAGTFATLMIIALSAVTAMGMAGWLGIKLTPPSATAPTIILTLAVADSIHILVTLLKSMRQGMAKNDAIVESIRINFGPVFLTSVTTIIGFMSLNFSDAPPFADLGNITSIGIFAAWVYSILFLPALIAVLPLRVKQQAADVRGGMDVFADFVIARRRMLLTSMVVVVVGLGALIPRIELNDQFVEYFDKDIQFRADTDFAADNLSGIYQLLWSLPAAEAEGINDPAYLRNVDDFANWLREQPGVVHVSTLTDTFRRLNKNMHADNAAYYTLPEDRDLAAQYLLLFEMSLPYGLDLNNQINVQKSATRLVATTTNFTTRDIRNLDQKSADWLLERFKKPDMHATGPSVMFAFITERNAKSMLAGTLIALVLISLCLLIALRDVKMGAVSLVPNLAPAIMTFGIWALLVGSVDVASSIVTATSLGIVVDATVHFLSKYLRARREKSLDVEAAVRYAFSTVGVALVVTALILIAGFGILALSSFKVNESMGLLTAIAVGMALFADFLLLPALLLTIDKRRSLSKKDEDNVEKLASQAAE